MPWCQVGITGLVGSLGVAIYDIFGGVIAERTTDGISELPVGSGVYFIPDHDLAYSLTYVWDYNGVYASDTIVGPGDIYIEDLVEKLKKLLEAKGIIMTEPEPDTNTGVIESVLTSIKKLLGIGSGYTQFDSELIMHINSAFSTVNQLGVGPTSPFVITGPDEKWDDFFSDKTILETVKTYVYLKVRLVFDPPQTGYLVDAMTKQIVENEWRLANSE